MWLVADWRDATAGRRESEYGPDRLDHFRLFCWRSNRNIAVSDWQLTTMLKMDEAYLDELTTPLEPKEPRNG